MSDQDIPNQALSRKRRLDYGNVPQWISAACAFALVALGVWGLFFSQTSQAIVSYLQSELVIRNQRIAALELRERGLQLSISQAEASLSGLALQKETLEREVAALRAEQEGLATKTVELGRTLSVTEFNLVREKLTAQQASVFGRVGVAYMGRSDGSRSKQVRLFDLFVQDIEEHAAGLPEAEKILAGTIIENFKRQCARLSHTLSSRSENADEAYKPVQALKACFKSVTP